MIAPTLDPAARRNAATLIELAIAEDLGLPVPALRLDVPSGSVVLEHGEVGSTGDITSTNAIPRDARGSARFVARSTGVLAGMPVLRMVADRFGLRWLNLHFNDGDAIAPGTVIAEVAGPMRELLAFERTALNFLQRLSGVATQTARFVAEVAGTKAVILDTRKTTPGWRALEKYAVRCGGGRNHRIGLYDAVLIKDNHLAWLQALGDDDPIRTSITRSRKAVPAGTIVEVEVDSLEQLEKALGCRPDIILVDNLGRDRLAEAVRLRDEMAPQVLLEASGGVTLTTVRGLAETGVDRISVGALTHSAPALDIALDFEKAEPSP